MAAVVRSGQINVLNEDNVMPYWWTTAQLRLQYPEGAAIAGDVDMQYLKREYEPTAWAKLCPDWAAPNKKGRPRNETRIQGALEQGGRGGRGRGRGRGRGHGRVHECGIQEPGEENGSSDDEVPQEENDEPHLEEGGGGNVLVDGEEGIV